MRRCPITYEEIPETSRYSDAGLKLLARKLTDLKDLPYSAEEQRQEAVLRATKMSIQGVQPKLSARLIPAEQTFAVVDTGGEYILKPPTHFPEVPANEDLTMKLAKNVGIDVPLHGLVYSKGGSLTYFVKRFDRTPKGKLQLEDFSQLLGMSRETKYDSSMEQVASILDDHCTFPLLEKVKLLRLTLFNFLVGNEDAHLKNFSLITKGGKIELSPGYDLVNTTIAIGNAQEELALPLRAKKRRLSRSDILDYFARERLGLTDAVVNDLLSDFRLAKPDWEALIQRSFLSKAMRRNYIELLRIREGILE